MTRADRGRVARGALSLFTTSDLADALATEVTAANASRAPVMFWLMLARAGYSLLLREFLAFPIRLAGLTAAGHAVAIALSYAFVFAPRWLVRRPYDESLLASFWIRHIAQICSSVGALRVWEYLVGPFIVGLLVAWLARGHELAVCAALLVSELVVIEFANVLDGHVWPVMLLTLLFVPLRYLTLFAAGISVRMFRDRRF